MLRRVLVLLAIVGCVLVGLESVNCGDDKDVLTGEPERPDGQSEFTESNEDVEIETLLKQLDQEVELSALHPLKRRGEEKSGQFKLRLKGHDALAEAIKKGITAAIKCILPDSSTTKCKYSESGDFTYEPLPKQAPCPPANPTHDKEDSTPANEAVPEEAKPMPVSEPRPSQQEHRFSFIARRLNQFYKLWPLAFGLQQPSKEDDKDKGDDEQAAIERAEHEKHMTHKLRTFLKSFNPEKKMRMLTNPGSSSAQLYQTHDLRYLVKTGVKKGEVVNLMEMLDRYIGYIRKTYAGAEYSSLMMLYFGFFEYRPHPGCNEVDGERYETTDMVLMEFIGPWNAAYFMKFDLKGCERQRYVDNYDEEKDAAFIKRSVKQITGFLSRWGLLSSNPSTDATTPSKEQESKLLDEWKEARKEMIEDNDHDNKGVMPSEHNEKEHTEAFVHIEKITTKQRDAKQFLFTYAPRGNLLIPSDFSTNTFTYRDLNFTHRIDDGIWFHPDDHAKIMKALKEDVKELVDWEVMDYSIFLVTSRVEFGKRKKMKPLRRNEYYAVINPQVAPTVTDCDTAAQTDIAGTVVVVNVSLIDFLGKWLLLRHGSENIGKSIAGFFSRKYKKAAVTWPTIYGPRLEGFVDKRAFKSITNSNPDKVGENASKLFAELHELRAAHDKEVQSALERKMQQLRRNETDPLFAALRKERKEKKEVDTVVSPLQLSEIDERIKEETRLREEEQTRLREEEQTRLREEEQTRLREEEQTRLKEEAAAAARRQLAEENPIATEAGEDKGKDKKSSSIRRKVLDLLRIRKSFRGGCLPPTCIFRGRKPSKDGHNNDEGDDVELPTRLVERRTDGEK